VAYLSVALDVAPSTKSCLAIQALVPDRIFQDQHRRPRRWTHPVIGLAQFPPQNTLPLV